MFKVSSVNVLPPQAASTALAMLNAKPLPDLSLRRDIWTLLNRSNSTKERWRNGREVEEEKEMKEERNEGCQCREVTADAAQECVREKQRVKGPIDLKFLQLQLHAEDFTTPDQI